LERFELSTGALRLIRSARTAHLATSDKSGQPHVIPICFVRDGKFFYSPIDEKPKRTVPSKLKRLKNIRENPNVALVIDHYDEDWRKLAYVLVFGKARIVQSGEKHRSAVQLLRKKYAQYRSMAIHERPMILITAKRIVSWGDP
jgi:PPOX class probable F420-dependent enzyme